MIITDPPDLDLPNTIVTIGNNACLEEDTILTLNCTISQGTRPVRYRWTRNGEVVPVFPPVQFLRVRLPGTYVCSVSNSFGDDSATSVITGKDTSTPQLQYCHYLLVYDLHFSAKGSLPLTSL